MCRLLFILFLLCRLLVVAQLKPAIFSMSEASVQEHRTLAILPFYCMENPEEFSKAPSYMTVQDKQLGEELQHSLYKMMISFSNRFSVAVQDIYATNERLQASGFTDYRFADMKAVAGVLNTDAVVWCVVTHGSGEFLEDSSMRSFLSRQHIPAEAKRKDVFLSIFNHEGNCIWTLTANSELLRRMIYFENNRMYWFEWMQYMPYWMGEKLRPI